MLENFDFMILYRSSGIRFTNGFRYQYALWVLRRCFEKLRPTQGHATVAMCSTSRLGCDILSPSATALDIDPDVEMRLRKNLHFLLAGIDFQNSASRA